VTTDNPVAGISKDAGNVSPSAPPDGGRHFAMKKRKAAVDFTRQTDKPFGLPPSAILVSLARIE